MTRNNTSEARSSPFAARLCGRTEWIIVNDGSTDRTGEIVDRFATEHPWITVVHRENRGFRKSGGGVMEAFYEGYKAIQHQDWEFLVKLDADLTFEADYFEKCFEHFQQDPNLGIGGGEIRHDIAGEMKAEKNPSFHVRGATKIYRRDCWEAIDGLWSASGWDTIDEVKANMKGWKTLYLHGAGPLPSSFHGIGRRIAPRPGEAWGRLLRRRISSHSLWRQVVCIGWRKSRA